MVNFGNLEPEEVAACHFQNESGFYFLTEEPETEAPAPRKKAQPVTTTAPTVEVLADAVPASTPTDILSSLPLPIPDGGVAQVQAFVEGPANLQAALPKDANGYTVLLGVVAVAGGGAAWKFYNDYSKRKHEEAMARIEREPQQQDDAHKKCDAARFALETRLNEAQARLEAANVRLESLQQAVSSLQNAPAPKAPAPFDASELEDRLAKLEKAAKKGKK